MGRIIDEMDAAIKKSGMTTFELSDFIDKWIFSARDRKTLKLKFCHGLTYAQVAEHLKMSDKQIERDVKRCVRQLKLHM